MKLERRGKYPGVKVHLDEKECKTLIDLSDLLDNIAQGPSEEFVCRLGGKIAALLAEEPDLLDERSEEQIKAVLEAEAETAQAKLNAIQNGSDWKESSAGKSEIVKEKLGKPTSKTVVTAQPGPPPPPGSPEFANLVNQVLTAKGYPK